MKKRNIAELLPFLIAFLSAAIFFGMPLEILEWYVRPTISIFIALSGIAVGWYYGEKLGRNGVVLLGVSACVLLLFIEIPIMMLAKAWN